MHKGTHGGVHAQRHAYGGACTKACVGGVHTKVCVNYISRSKSMESKPAKTGVNVCFMPILSFRVVESIPFRRLS